jgi:tRNA(fMet)-specific endonuclease VapC
MSEKYLLDTHIISHMMRDANGIAAQHFIQIAKRSDAPGICTSVVVQCELLFGLARRPNPRLEMAYERVIQSLEVLALDSETASYYAQLRTALETQGTPIGPNDTLIAAHALALDCTLVIGNEAEFRRVPGLRVDNWLLEESA